VGLLAKSLAPLPGCVHFVLGGGRLFLWPFGSCFKDAELEASHAWSGLLVMLPLVKLLWPLPLPLLTAGGQQVAP
jgi:hypothetical protein